MRLTLPPHSGFGCHLSGDSLTTSLHNGTYHYITKRRLVSISSQLQVSPQKKKIKWTYQGDGYSSAAAFGNISLRAHFGSYSAAAGNSAAATVAVI